MKLSHRLRMIALLNRADSVLRKAKQERERINRPHQQSIHMIGYPVPRDYSVTPRYVSLVLVLISAVVFFNMARDTIQ